jgi:8-oxo-dGTP pyrophosphatase MutT (NUDIX family)
MTAPGSREREIARVKTVDSVRYRLVTDMPWQFAQERAEEIDALWKARCARNPHLFNGQVILMHRTGREEDCGALLEGTCFMADYKAFAAWRDFGFPESGALNVFAMAALRSADGAFLLGEMAATTAHAGQIYFPAGTPDPEDLKDGFVDFEGSVRRELHEETGIGAAEVIFAEGWTVVFHGPYVACMKNVRSALSAAELVAQTDAFLAKEKNPELARLRPVFSETDFVADRMPAFIPDYIRHVWRGER